MNEKYPRATVGILVYDDKGKILLTQSPNWGHRWVVLGGGLEYAADVFGSTDGIAHLNLITREGVWSETNKSYSGRLVLLQTKKQ